MASPFRVVIYILIEAASCSLTNDYFQQLISEEISKSQSYQLPKNNEEFRGGINSVDINDFSEYDVVVVGAGSAGSVVATRLSEIDDISILLIEAGGEENDFNQIPAMWPYHQFSDLNWGYYSTPQKHSCLGMENKQCPAIRGKVIGGCSSINGAIYARGNCEDYDRWAALGNCGWSCKEVLPYFKKSENSQVGGDASYHNVGGFWNIEYPLSPSPILHALINASVEVGQPIVDYNGRNQFTTGNQQSNIKRGRKQSLATAFLNNARKREKVKVVTRALVTKVTIDEESKEAKGVEFATKNRKFQVRAKKVVLSAGAYNTPQILMLSGIGPKEHLREMNISLIADLPVGLNLIEHPYFTARLSTNYTLHVSMEDIVDQYLNGLGILTRGNDGLAFIRTKNSNRRSPSIQFIPIPEYDFGSTVYSRGKYYPNPQVTILMIVGLLHERSRGRVFLKSSSPIDFPNIDFNMLEKQEDVDNLLEGVKYVVNLLETQAFKKINATLLEVPLCRNFTKGSTKHWECLIRQYTVAGFHSCGTAAMGPDNKKFVVNDKLQVHGVAKLRVVDASIFPDSVSGNTNAPTVMVAEKAADIIKSAIKH